MHIVKVLSASCVALLLFSCSGDDQEQPVSVTDRVVLEAEQASVTSGSGQLDWVLVALNDDYGSAARLVSSDDARWSEDGLAALSYDIDFANTGQYRLALRGRQDSNTPSTAPVFLTFSADDADIQWEVTGIDDQWTWHRHDRYGQQMLFAVTSVGVHQLRIASAAEGLMLDQVEISSLGDGNYPSIEEEPQADSGTAPATSDDVPESGVESSPQERPPVQAEQSSQTETNQPQVNQPPAASINAVSALAAGETLGVSVSASDDGLPHGGLYYYWSKTAGPGPASFSAVQAPVSSVSFGVPGTYEIQATVSDGEQYINVTHTILVTQTDATGPETDDLPSTLSWRTITSYGAATPRHETGGVVVNNKLYLIGGRGERPVEVYDPATNSWSRISNAPLEMHHFQPVAIGHKIYIIGAFTCCYPEEKVIDNIYIFDTLSHQWSTGPEIPDHRKRGSTGAVVHDGRIYLLGGNTRGHSGGAVNWFDEFDPATGKWRALADAPDARDHLTIALVNKTLVAAGGRQTSAPFPFAKTVSRTNIFDFNTGSWSTVADIPTSRAGTMTVALGDEVIVIGGESAASNLAHKEVEAYNVTTGGWRSLAPMTTARHGGAAGILNGQLHVVTGNTTRRGGAETASHEVLR